jgi:putative ABC transport system permease protein
MQLLRQSLALGRVGLQSLPRRLGPSSVTLVGILVVVAVLASMLAVGEGVTTWAVGSSRPDRIVILSQGAQSAAQSSLPRDTVARLSAVPGIKKGTDGKPLISASATGFVEVVKGANRITGLGVVGMSNLAVFPEIHLVQGRWYQPGLRELVASPVAQQMYRGLQIGDRVAMRGGEWTIVGTFQSTGGAYDQLLFTDNETLLGVNHDTYLRQVVALLDDPADFDAVRAAIEADPTTRVSVYTEKLTRLKSLGDLPAFVDFVSYFVGGLLAAGALCAAVSSLYMVVDTRRGEIATLRAMGFASLPILISVLLEGLFIALLAAVAGALLAWVVFHGNLISMQNRTFPMAVSPHVLGISVGLALAIGLIGALFPAVRAARQSVTAGLREI